MKKLFCFLLIVSMLMLDTAFAFNDVLPESELGTEVQALVDCGVVKGYEDGTFRPDKPITRAEFCKMINTLFNFTGVGVNDFTDVFFENWFYMDVLIANEYEYIKGYEDGTFRGNNKVTREQASVIVGRITPLLEIENTVTITDAVSDWARDAVQMVANHKLLKTGEDGCFRAKEYITRGELASLLYRFIPKPKTDAYEKGYSGTNAEIAIENAVILANLKAAIRDIEKVTFNENEKQLIEYVLIGLKGTADAGLKGNLINKNYVVDNYWSEIVAARKIYKNMSDTEKSYFHNNLVMLNNSTLVFLQSYFLGDKSPI